MRRNNACPWRQGLLIVLIPLLLAAALPAAAAREAFVAGSLVVLPVVRDGERVVSLELAIVPGVFPIELELLSVQQAFFPESLDSAYFAGDTLIVPALHAAAKVWWVELRRIGRGRFVVREFVETVPIPAWDPPRHFDEPFWQRIAGRARDVGIGADGTVWLVGESHGKDTGLSYWGEYGLYEVLGDAVRVDVDPWGLPWVVTADDAIYRLARGHWQRISGWAKDIGIGADGSVWVIGTNERGGGHGIFRLDARGWLKVPGSAVRIDVDPQGNPWVVNDDDRIYRLAGGHWERLPGKAKDIGIGADGSVWVIGIDEREGGYGIYRWNGYGWDKAEGSARQISVDPEGRPWVVNREGRIYAGASALP